MVSPRKILTNARAKAGDFLVLTKPLGTGIATTGIKRGLTSAKLSKAAIKLMSQVNTIGAELAERGLVRAATDITGFGLLGHLASMCLASGVSAEIFATDVYRLIDRDCIPGGTEQNLKTANARTKWSAATEAQKIFLADAQTSGGLLLAVSPRHLDQVIQLLTKRQTSCRAIIGKILPRRKTLITVSTS